MTQSTETRDEKTAALALLRCDQPNAALVAQTAKELGLPGKRSKTAIGKLRIARGIARRVSVTPNLQERFYASLVSKFSMEIRRRGGETSILSGATKSSARDIPLSVVDHKPGLTVLHVSARRFYSGNFGSGWAQLSYLCGTDDAGMWAVRIPGNITNISEAMRWITPTDVTTAANKGKRVLRQGDIYAIETTKAHDTKSGSVGEARVDRETFESKHSHFWDAQTRVLRHEPSDGRCHAPLAIDYPVRFVQQRAYQNGRGAGTGAAD